MSGVAGRPVHKPSSNSPTNPRAFEPAQTNGAEICNSLCLIAPVFLKNANLMETGETSEETADMPTDANGKRPRNMGRAAPDVSRFIGFLKKNRAP